MDELLASLSQNAIFRALTIQEIEELAPHIREERFEAGGKIFEQVTVILTTPGCAQENQYKYDRSG